MVLFHAHVESASRNSNGKRRGAQDVRLDDGDDDNLSGGIGGGIGEQSGGRGDDKSFEFETGVEVEARSSPSACADRGRQLFHQKLSQQDVQHSVRLFAATTAGPFFKIAL